MSPFIAMQEPNFGGYPLKLVDYMRSSLDSGRQSIKTRADKAQRFRPIEHKYSGRQRTKIQADRTQRFRPTKHRPTCDALLAASVDARHLFEDHAYGAKDDRSGLIQALTFVLPSDVLVVWKLDRLGRSLSHLLSMGSTFKERNSLSPEPTRHRPQHQPEVTVQRGRVQRRPSRLTRKSGPRWK